MQACIGFKHIIKAIEHAKVKLGFRDQKLAAVGAGKKKRHSMDELGAGGGNPLQTSPEPPSDSYGVLGEINMATTRILADQFDMSKSNFWPMFPLLVAQNLRSQ